jgi:hypothetical protein
MSEFQSVQIPLCNAADLANGGEAVPFDVVYCGRQAGQRVCRAL